jgi:hypothetical protein
MLALALFLVALILFLLAAFSFPPGVRINLVALGLAFLTAAIAWPMIHGG